MGVSRVGRLAAILLATSALTPAALAQDAQEEQQIAQAGMLEEITVTAQRREESLQTVPLAVTAFTELELERRQITDTLDLIDFVPNMVGSNNTGLGTANVYSIRGLNNTESIATFDPPVGTYVDGVFISRQNANNFALFDVDRIEVLRGPQGTLFGRNTTGGAINVILKKPGEELGGFVEAHYGRFQEFGARGSIDLPVNDLLLTKLDAYYIENDGYAENRTTGQTLNAKESFGVRGAARLLLSEDVTWDVSIDYIDHDEPSIANFREDGDGGDRIVNTGLRRGVAPLQGIITGDKQNFDFSNVVETLSVISNLQIGTEYADIEVITGFRDLSQEYLLDLLDAPLPVGGFALSNDGEHVQFTQEIKASGMALDDRLNYVVGAFYLYEDNQTDFSDVVFGTVLADRTLENTAEAYALYGQFDYDVTEDFTLTAGIRWTEETKDIAYLDNNNPLALSTLTTDALIQAGIPTEQTTSIWTPRFAAEYRFTDEVMVFASATRGFKSGGWNARDPNPALNTPFDPEVVWSYEAGVRSDWLDGRLRANVTAFYSDISDFQLPTDALDETTPGPDFVTDNFADLEVYGLETEISAVPLDNLNLYASLGLQSGEYKNLSQQVLDQQATCLVDPTFCGGIITADGSIADPTRLPEITLSVGGNYSWQIADSLELVPSVNLRWVEGHHRGSNNSPADFSGDYTQVRAALSLQDVGDSWSATLECDNCFDESYVTSVLIFPYINSPGMWKFRVRYNF